ncbi:receptor-interacting serine/threonine-protein kinase 3 isoform X2 [Mugil cephalus]|uniref:receptor-interacting serine/threonine-protein kinase 3 isoform X2 n=1 Tax=Mugil cephalus TaxID=48193 RepID=UPI001FB83358|nr:receptor-interacting serine/threonine-protein kinase 3 isoform X2 [Mugil cephalus]
MMFDMMRQGSNPHVIHVFGVFRGQLPFCTSTPKLGLVMEFMERGSLASLQKTLQGPSPWPLTFRLTHQVALGINFLHNLSPAILHLDLKPNNVLLDSALNVKLTDFGLAKFYHTVRRISKESNDEGGTLSYMPPEAFSVSYHPTLASDIYSYGIVLWSIVTGRQPYPYAMSSIVRLRIPQGDRPPMDEIRSQAAGIAGLTRLVELMERCWETKPSQRPSSFDCTAVTEELYKMHKHAIRNAVDKVLETLDQKEEEERLAQEAQTVYISQTSASARLGAVNHHCCDNVPTGGPPIQEMAGDWTANQRDKARVTNSSSPRSMCHGEQARMRENMMKTSSVHPIQPSLPPLGKRRIPQDRGAQSAQLTFDRRQLSQYQRQYSTPDTASHRPRVCINLSNVTGLQNGDNNTMHIYATDPFERRRHPTAPSNINH